MILPSSGVVFAQALTIVIIPTWLVGIILIQVHFLGILLEVGHVVSCVSALKDRVGSLRLLLAFPEKVLTKTDSKFGGKHVSPGGSR